MISLIIALVVQFIILFPLYLILCFLPLAYLRYYQAKLGITTLSIEGSQESYEITKNDELFTFTGMFNRTIRQPYLEEVIYRYIPYFLVGLPGAIAGSVVWSLAHPIFQADAIRGHPKFKKWFTVSSVCYLIPSIFYIIILAYFNPVFCLVYHSLHNSLGEYSIQRYLNKIKKEIKEKGYFKTKEEKSEEKSKQVSDLSKKVDYSPYFKVKKTVIENLPVKSDKNYINEFLKKYENEEMKKNMRKYFKVRV